MKEIIYKDLSKITASELAGKKGSRKLWQKLPYETAEFKGVGLLAGENSYPEALVLKLNVKGWHKIYLGMTQIGSSNMISVALSKEKRITPLVTSHLDFWDGNFSWARYDWCEEIYYTSADLTEQDLIIDKAKLYPLANTVALLYVKLVAMSQEEIAEYQNPINSHRIAHHFDLDYICWNNYKKVDDYLGVIKRLHGGNGDVLIHEATVNSRKPHVLDYSSYHEKIKHSEALFCKKKAEIYEKLAEEAHSMGMKIVTGYRIEAISSFVQPFVDGNMCYGCCEPKKEYRLETREGRFNAANSYAYPEIRTEIKNVLLEGFPASWDGICLYLHRGILVGFEQPVRDRVFEKYGVDAKRLPYGDARLTDVLCEVMTSFIKEMKKGLQDLAKANGKEKYLLQVVSLYDIQNCKEFGYDIEAWAKEGLIDGVYQGLMGYREALGGCIAEDGLIDLEAYSKAQKARHVFIRKYDDAIPSILQGIPDWLALAEKYNVDFYAALPWEHGDYNKIMTTAKALYEAGADKFFSWDSGQSIRVAALQARKDAGDKEKTLAYKESQGYRKVTRVLSLGDCDISTFNVNWMG